MNYVNMLFLTSTPILLVLFFLIGSWICGVILESMLQRRTGSSQDVGDKEKHATCLRTCIPIAQVLSMAFCRSFQGC